MLMHVVNWRGCMAEKQQVVFKVDNEEYSLDILSVQEIIRYQQVTKIPNSPQFVIGVINLRGKIIPIISLRNRLGLNDKEINEETRVIVVQATGKTYGIIVDAVSEVITINDNEVEQGNFSQKTSNQYFLGIAKKGERLLILLDINSLF